METFILIMRIIFIVVGSLVSLLYILFQLFQKLPQNSFKFSTFDIIALLAVSVIFGFGVNNYYGLLAFVPLILIKFLFRAILTPNKLQGSGQWVEVNWRKLTPRGFEKNVPKSVMQEMNKMPGDNHFIIPRFYLMIFIKFITNKMTKEMKNSPGNMPKGQQEMAMNQFTSIIDNVVKLKSGQFEKKDFPFGVLKITRL